MKLKELIKQTLTGELADQGFTVESLLELELTKCNQQTLDELGGLFYNLSDACVDLDSYLEDKLIDLIIAQYGGEVCDWVEVEGPDSSVGNDHYFTNLETDQEVYVNVDQGVVTMELCGE